MAGKGLATAYELQRKVSTSSTWESVATDIKPVVSARTTYDDTDDGTGAILADNTCYQYRVRAKNSAGYSVDTRPSNSEGWTQSNGCQWTLGPSAPSRYNAPPRPTAVAHSDNKKYIIRVVRPITGTDARRYQLARRLAACSATSYTTIRDTNENSSNSGDATVDFTLTNNSGSGTGRVPTGVNNAEPTGLHLYRARIPGPPPGNGSWSLPVLIRTNSDGTKEYITHVASASEEDRFDTSGTCASVP